MKQQLLIALGNELIALDQMKPVLAAELALSKHIQRYLNRLLKAILFNSAKSNPFFKSLVLGLIRRILHSLLTTSTTVRWKIHHSTGGHNYDGAIIIVRLCWCMIATDIIAVKIFSGKNSCE